MRHIRRYMALTCVLCTLLAAGVTAMRWVRRSHEITQIRALLNSEAAQADGCRGAAIALRRELEKLDSKASPRTERFLDALTRETPGDSAAAMRAHRNDLRRGLLEHIAECEQEAERHESLRLRYERMLLSAEGRSNTTDP
jgi:hypothetical protein